VEMCSAIVGLPAPVIDRFTKHIQDAVKLTDGTNSLKEYAAFLEELLAKLPALNNYIELLTTIAQNPTQKFEMNDFFDHEIMPVPLAYADVFVAQDKGMKHLLGHSTKVMARTSCHYCYTLDELYKWMVRGV
jgi:hypothetical protein